MWNIEGTFAFCCFRIRAFSNNNLTISSKLVVYQANLAGIFANAWVFSNPFTPGVSNASLASRGRTRFYTEPSWNAATSSAFNLLLSRVNFTGVTISSRCSASIFLMLPTGNWRKANDPSENRGKNIKTELFVILLKCSIPPTDMEILAVDRSNLSLSLWHCRDEASSMDRWVPSKRRCSCR